MRFGSGTRSLGRITFVAIILLLFASRSAPAAGQELKEFDADYLESPSGGPELDEAATAIIRSTNALRKEQGREPVKVNGKLTRAARYFASYLARANKFAHDADGNRPADRVSLFGYEYCLVAENIAYQEKSQGFKTAELSGAVFESWKTSPAHLANILDSDVTEVGVAIGHDPKSDRYYAVQDFGRPASAAIQFAVTNNTPDTLQYAVAGVGRDKSSAKTFELPPRTSMHHTRCRSAMIDWGWTKADDKVTATSQRAYVIAKTERGYQVTEQAASQ